MCTETFLSSRAVELSVHFSTPEKILKAFIDTGNSLENYIKEFIQLYFTRQSTDSSVYKKTKSAY